MKNSENHKPGCVLSREFDEAVKTGGLENMSVIPDRLITTEKMSISAP